MNIFLTGEKQIGKTTIIEKTLALLNKDYGGFKTYFGPDRDLPNRLLYMNSIKDPYIYNEEYGIVQISHLSKPQVILNRFNTLGVRLIKEAIENKQLLVMDECGGFEKNSFEFQEQIYKALDSNVPILGVIKLESRGWVDKIRNHPEVELIIVTKDNRDKLPKILYKKLTEEPKEKGV